MNTTKRIHVLVALFVGTAVAGGALYFLRGGSTLPAQIAPEEMITGEYESESYGDASDTVGKKPKPKPKTCGVESKSYYTDWVVGAVTTVQPNKNAATAKAIEDAKQKIIAGEGKVTVVTSAMNLVSECDKKVGCIGEAMPEQMEKNCQLQMTDPNKACPSDLRAIKEVVDPQGNPTGKYTGAVKCRGEYICTLECKENPCKELSKTLQGPDHGKSDEDLKAICLSAIDECEKGCAGDPYLSSFNHNTATGQVKCTVQRKCKPEKGNSAGSPLPGTPGGYPVPQPP